MVQKKITTKTSLTLKNICYIGSGKFSNEDGDTIDITELCKKVFGDKAFTFSASMQVDESSEIEDENAEEME